MTVSLMRFAGSIGVSLRGDLIAPPLPGANVAFGGVMGQGKSNAARSTMAGAAVDPLAELWVIVSCPTTATSTPTQPLPP